MVASTDIKFYVHTNNNAPQLQNAYGSMINVLDACLVNGIQIGTISSLTASGTTVTATFSSAHNLMQYQVIKIAGATQSEFNGEHRILTVPNAQSVTFELAASPSTNTATGTISASLPPLGWEKPFSSVNAGGGGKAAYRSKNLLLPSRPFLRVVDELDPAYTATYAKYAKVGIVEDMMDIDTMLGVQAPYDSTNSDKNWLGTGSGANVINGWAKWYYTTNSPLSTTAIDTSAPATGIRSWCIIGTSDFFYIFVSPYLGTDVFIPYGFGAFESNLIGDSANAFMNATTNYHAANTNYQKPLYSGCVAAANQPYFVQIQRNYTMSSAPAIGVTSSLAAGGNSSASHSGGSDYVNPSSVTGIILFSPVFLWEVGSSASSASNAKPILLRGKMPLLQWLYQLKPLTNKSVFSQNGCMYICLDSYTNGVAQLICQVG